ncbi:MAG: hypothetical protein NTX75_17350 [Proteobacteria bacterium]|nr:hypothetical protein [Pseudomonadota bacterium]
MPDELFRIVAVDVANAHHVGTVFRSLYGEDFPVKDVYQPEVLWKEIQAGRLVSALAFDVKGQAVGYISMFKTAPNPRLWEAGNMLVDPGYAHTNISSHLIRCYFDPAMCRMTDIDGIFNETVCCHFFTQVSAAKIGMTDCALELDQLDGDSFKDGKSNKTGTARVSCVLYFWELTDLLEAEYVPVRYDTILKRIAGSLRPRILFPSTDALPTDGSTSLEEKYYASAKTWKVVVPMVGGNWAAAVEDILSKAKQRRVISLQVTLNMACPHIGAAVDLLREKGFFFGGMAPRWFGTDGLLMQKLFGSETEYEKTKLYTPFSKELLAFIRSDREAIRGV